MPLVPVTINGCAPSATELPAVNVRVRVLEAFGAICAGLNCPPAGVKPLGNPETVRPTPLLNPFVGFMVIVVLALPLVPLIGSVRVSEEDVRLKSVTLRVNAAV